MLAWWLRNTVVPLWALYERSPYLQVAARLERSSCISADEREARQLALLQAMLAHAARNVPFYTKRFSDSGFEPGDLRRIEDLSRLPLLTKQDVRAETATLVSTIHSQADLVRNTTSGSTG